MRLGVISDTHGHIEYTTRAIKVLEDQKIDALMLPYLAAGVKATLGLLGFEGMHPRSPTRPVPADVVVQLEQLLREAGLL